MHTIITPLLTATLAYLVGAIPFGYLIARWRGVDIFAQGSGNIGATNVGRVLGWRFGILVFLLDFAKGAVPTAVAMAIGFAPTVQPHIPLGVVAGLAGFVGHMFPIYLRFRGGKGVATGAGVVAVLLPLPTLLALSTWLVVLCTFRFVSLASLAAAAVLCAAYFALSPAPFENDRLILTLFCLVACTMVFVKHRGNVVRLLRGTENRLPERTVMQLASKTIHVLAVGLWFGMAVFFSFPVALTLFRTFESEAAKPAAERPTWFPLPDEYTRKIDKDSDRTMQKDQGTRAAGFAISPLFDQYFLWQGICGLLACVTALSWSRAQPGRRVHGIRVVVVMLALTTVILGWPLERTVSNLREARNEASDQLMLALKSGNISALDQARSLHATAQQEFGKWHVWSLLLNMGTIGLVTVAMALAAQLPAPRETTR